MKSLWSVERLFCNNLEVTLIFIMTLEAQLKIAEAKYAKMVEKTGQCERILRSRITLLESSLEEEIDLIARLEKDCVDKPTEEKHVLADRSDAYNTIKCQLRNKDEA